MTMIADLIKAATDAKAAQADGDDAAADPIATAAELVRQAEAADLAQLEADAVAQFRELYAEGEFAPEAAPQLEAVADVADAVRTVAAEQQAARDELNERVGELANRIDPPQDQAHGDSEAEGDQPADPEQPADGERDDEPGDPAPAAA